MADSYFYRRIGLDTKAAALNRKLDKKMFYDYAELNRKEKDAIGKYIDRMELAFLLSPSAINIQPFINEEFHYEGVMFIHVRLKDGTEDRHVQSIAGIIHGALPNPVVIVFERGGHIQASTCMKRLSKAEKGAVVHGKTRLTGWLDTEIGNGGYGEEDGRNGSAWEEFLDAIHMSNLPFTDFYEFYREIDLAAEATENAKATGGFKLLRNEEDRELMTRIQSIDNEIVSLKARIKKESQFNKKAELNVGIQKLVKEADKLRKQLKGS